MSRVGETAAVHIEGPRPYPPGDGSLPVVWSHTLRHPGATFIKPRIASLDLGPEDALELRDARGHLIARYGRPDGARAPFWGPSVSGDTAVLQLRAAEGGGGGGVAVDRYGHGTGPIVARSVCGSNESEDVTCYAASPVGVASRAVGLLLFERGGGLFACTGFLVSRRDHLLTNRHCIASQASVDSLEVWFDYERETCGGGAARPPVVFAGERFLAADHRLDVALVTLAGRPSLAYGYLPLADRDPVLGEAAYIPQHPLAGPKRVSVIGCEVSTARTRGRGPGTDLGHTCDTQPGSSGSPVLDLEHQVIGLHHFGGCGPTGGENQAVIMRQALHLLPPRETSLELREVRLVFGDNPADGRLILRGTLVLGPASDGIDPRAEPVALALADGRGALFSARVPPGHFRRKNERYVFDDPSGVLADGLEFLRVEPRDRDSYWIYAEARGLDLTSATAGEITVTLEVGDDIAARAGTFRNPDGKLVFP